MSDGARRGGDSDGFGRQGRAKTLLFYGVILVVALVVLDVVLHVGRGLRAPRASSQVPGTAKDAIDVHAVFWKFLVAAALIVVASHLLGAVFRRFHQPQVVGEILAGVLLGPSALGAVLPGFSHQVFTPQVMPFLEVTAQLGLIFFMFLIGLELDTRLIRGRGHAATAVSHVSILVPFLLGAAAALVLFPSLGSASGRFVPFALFLGASMSVTAFPVLARILSERGLYKTKLGTVAITCAAVDDVTAWCLLAVVVAVAASAGLGGAFVTIGLSVVFITFMVVVVRPLLRRVADYHEAHGEVSGPLLAMIIIGILLSALATDRIGIHAIFGAFLFGAVMPQRSELVGELVGKLEDFTVLFLLPLFFAFSGLRTQIGLLGTDPKMWLFCLLVLGVAVAGKWGGSAFAGRVVGLQWREALGLGVLMNCRGLTELVILNIGLDLGVIPPALFAILVIMALVTTFMTTPLLSVFYPREVQERMIAEEGGEEGEHAWRVLVPIAKLDRAYELVHTALSLAEARGVRAQVVLVRALSTPALRAGPMRMEAATSRAMSSLRPLVEFVEGAGHDAVALALPSESVADAILRVATERRPDLVLMGWRKPLFGRGLLDGVVGEIVERADADVAILIDPTGRGTAVPKDGCIVVPFGGGFHENVGMDLALRLARTSGAHVRIVGLDDAGAPHALAETAAQAYERTGVWTDAVPTDDVVAEVIRQGRDADLVVLGVSDEWARNRRSLGPLREAVAARVTAPLLVVRRHGQRKKLLKSDQDWMRESTERQGAEVAVAARGRDVS